MPLPIKLSLPHMAAKDASEAQASASEPEKLLLRMQVLAGSLLRGDENSDATPERLAWLALWTRAFNTIDGARGAVWQNSILSLTLLERSAFEAGLQVRCIVEPFLREPRPADAEAEVAARFRAFTAWAIWSDRQVYQDYARSDNIERVWDPEPARRLAASGPVRDLFANVFGEPEILNQHELDAEKAKYTLTMQGVVDFLGGLLDDPSIADWVAKIEANKPRQFYELFDPSHSNVKQHVKDSGHEHIYSVFKHQSIVAHGASLEPFLLFLHGVAAPKLPRDGRDVHKLADSVASFVGTQVIDLKLSKFIAWPTHAR